MNVIDILNSKPLYGIVIAGLLFVLVVCVLFLKKAWKRAKELGYTEDTLRGIIKSSVMFSIVPSLAIVIALFSLSNVLGIPWSWFRLSVVGSLSYELLAGDMAATGAGFASLSEFVASDDISMVTTVMMVMSLSIIGGIIFNLIFGKKIQSGMLDYQEKNSEWGMLALSYFTLSMATVFLPVQISESPVHFATMATSTILTLIQIFIVKKFKAEWLSEFILANTLILGMVSSVFWHSVLL